MLLQSTDDLLTVAKRGVFVGVLLPESEVALAAKVMDLATSA